MNRNLRLFFRLAGLGLIAGGVMGGLPAGWAIGLVAAGMVIFLLGGGG